MIGNRKTVDQITQTGGGASATEYSRLQVRELYTGLKEQSFLSPRRTSNSGSVEQASFTTQKPGGESARWTLSSSTSSIQILAILNRDAKPDHVTAWAQDDKSPSLKAQSPESSSGICKYSDVNTQIIVTQFEHLALKNYLLGAPAVDDLLTLIPFNMYRALLSNAQALGYDLEEIGPDVAISQFYNTNRRDWKFPPSLHPTKIQCEISHHPWLDLFPIPRMRDNMILAGSALDEQELCVDLVGFTSRKAGMGIAIWGEAWDPLNWELTEAFIRNWTWTLEGCHDLLRSTNMLRAKRGEKPLNS